MNPTHTPLLRSILVTAGLCAAASLQAQILYSQDFNTPNSATPLSSFSWTAFNGGAPSGPTINSSGTTTGGIFDVQRAAFVNLNTTNATTSWFGGLRYIHANPLPVLDLSQLSLSANVYAGGSVGARGDVTLRIESSANNWIGWTVPGATLTVTNGVLTGGLLSDATHSAGSFDVTASSFNIVVAFANTLGTWGNDSSNIVGADNVLLQQVPEPSAWAPAAAALSFALCLTRRRR